MTLDSLNRAELLNVVQTFKEYEKSLRIAKNALFDAENKLKQLPTKPSLSAIIFRKIIIAAVINLFVLGVPVSVLYYWFDLTEVVLVLFYVFQFILIVFLGKRKYDKLMIKYNDIDKNIRPGLGEEFAKCRGNVAAWQNKLNQLYDTYCVPKEYRYESTWEGVYKRLEFSSTTTINQALSEHNAELYRKHSIEAAKELQYQQAMQTKAIDAQTQAIKDGNEQLDRRMYELNETVRRIDDYNRYG